MGKGERVFGAGREGTDGRERGAEADRAAGCGWSTVDAFVARAVGAGPVALPAVPASEGPVMTVSSLTAGGTVGAPSSTRASRALWTCTPPADVRSHDLRSLANSAAVE